MRASKQCERTRTGMVEHQLVDAHAERIHEFDGDEGLSHACSQKKGRCA